MNASVAPAPQHPIALRCCNLCGGHFRPSNLSPWQWRCEVCVRGQLTAIGLRLMNLAAYEHRTLPLGDLRAIVESAARVLRGDSETAWQLSIDNRSVGVPGMVKSNRRVSQ